MLRKHELALPERCRRRPPRLERGIYRNLIGVRIEVVELHQEDDTATIVLLDNGLRRRLPRPLLENVLFREAPEPAMSRKAKYIAAVGAVIALIVGVGELL